MGWVLFCAYIYIYIYIYIYTFVCVFLCIIKEKHMVPKICASRFRHFRCFPLYCSRRFIAWCSSSFIIFLIYEYLLCRCKRKQNKVKCCQNTESLWHETVFWQQRIRTKTETTETYYANTQSNLLCPSGTIFTNNSERSRRLIASPCDFIFCHSLDVIGFNSPGLI